MTFQFARLGALVLAAAALPALAADSKAIVVNGKTIPAANLDTMVKIQVSRGQPDTPELRAQLKRQLINIELLAQEGTRLGLDKTAETKTELDLARKEILGRAMVNDFAKKNAPKEAELKAEYDRYKTQLTGVTEYHAHHIVLAKEDEAKDVIAKLKGGAKFEELVKLSKDTASAANGGDLDWGPAAKYPKPFADALIALQKGQVADAPVKTQFGFHVVKLDDTRPAKIASYEEIKPKMSSFLTQKKLQEFQQELEKKAKIEN